MRAKSRGQHIDSIQPKQDLIYLDGPESLQTRRFIAGCKGRAMLTRHCLDGQETGSSSLMDLKTCMEIGQGILRSGCADDGDLLPPIVDNLCQLIKSLEMQRMRQDLVR
jgi:hypothetical protein